MSDRVTECRPPWHDNPANKRRHRGPLTDAELYNLYRYGSIKGHRASDTVSTVYRYVYLQRGGGWKCSFSYQSTLHYVGGGFKTDRDAAIAYNAYLVEHDIDRPLQTILDNDDAAESA